MGFIPGDLVRLTLDGVSLSPYLQGGEQVTVTDEMVLVFLRAWHKVQDERQEYPDDAAMKAGLEAVFTHVRRELMCSTMAHGAESPLRAGMDVVQRAQPFMAQCGPCDFGLADFGCACPTGDFRPIVADLVAEMERLRKAVRDLEARERFWG